MVPSTRLQVGRNRLMTPLTQQLVTTQVLVLAAAKVLVLTVAWVVPALAAALPADWAVEARVPVQGQRYPLDAIHWLSIWTAMALKPSAHKMAPSFCSTMTPMA